MAQHSVDRKYAYRTLTDAEKKGIPRMLQSMQKSDGYIWIYSLKDLGWKLSWAPFKGRLVPCVRDEAGQIVSPSPRWELGKPLDILMNPAVAKGFSVTINDLMANNELPLDARQVIALNEYDNDNEQFKILYAWLVNELGEQFAKWDTPGEDGEHYSRVASENVEVIRDGDNTKFYSAISEPSDKYGYGIKARCNNFTSNPSPGALDDRSKSAMAHLPEEQQDAIVEALRGDKDGPFSKRYAPMQFVYGGDADLSRFDENKFRDGAVVSAIYSFFSCMTRSGKKGGKKVTGGTVCRRCTKLIVFANGQDDGSTGGGRGLADFLEEAPPTPAPAEPEPAEEPVDKTPHKSRKHKLEKLAKDRRVKAKREKEDAEQ